MNDLYNACLMALDAYNQGPAPIKVRNAMDQVIDYIREAINNHKDECEPNSNESFKNHKNINVSPTTSF